MLIAHGPVATLLSVYANREEFGKLKITDKVLFLLCAFLIGILPDFDIFYLVAKGQSAFIHHQLLTHTPIFYILLAIVIYLLMKLTSFPKSHKFRRMMLITFVISTLSHLFFDMFTGQIMLFYPFSKHFFSIFGYLLPDNLFSGYLAHPIFALEILILSSFIYLLIQIFLKIKVLILPILALIYLLFNIVMYTQTYQVEVLKRDENNLPVYDTDRDGLANTYDLDFDNNLVDNYRQVSKDEILVEFEKIPSSYIPSFDRNLWQNIKYTYGGHTLMRSILQSYAQTQNYLQPVVHDYMKKNSIEKFSNGIFDFLISTNDFKHNMKKEDIIPGALVYIQRENRFSLGIVNRDRNVLIDNENGIPTVFDKQEDILQFFIQQ